MTLDIPAGALTEDTEITIRRLNQDELPPDSEGTLLAYELLPDGLEFLLPVTATVEVDIETTTEDAVIDAEIPVITLLNSSGGVIEILENQLQNTDLDSGTSTISGELDHFSRIIIEETIEIPDPEDIFIGNPNLEIISIIPCIVNSEDRFLINTIIRLNTFGNQAKLGSFSAIGEDFSTELLFTLAGSDIGTIDDVISDVSTSLRVGRIYECLDVGEGIYKLSLTISLDIETTPGNFETFVFQHEIEKTIECVGPDDSVTPTPPTPTPSPTVTPEPTPEPPEQIATFDISTIGPINFTHNVGITPCPQEIAILEITNTGSQRTDITISSNSLFIDFGLAPLGNPPSLSGSLVFELEPGETRSVVVFFNCETIQSFMADIFVDGVLLSEGGGAVPGSGMSRSVMVDGTIVIP